MADVPFSLRTEIAVPKDVATRLDEGILYWERDADFVDAIFGAEVVPLPVTIATQVAPLLRASGSVHVSARVWDDGDGKDLVHKIELFVKPLRPVAELDREVATAVRRLRAHALTIHFRRRRERQRGAPHTAASGPQAEAVNKMPEEVLVNILERLPFVDVLEHAQLVRRAWKVAADTAAPLGSCRRTVAKRLLSRASTTARSVYYSTPSSQESFTLTPPTNFSRMTLASQSPVKDTRQGRSEPLEQNGTLRLPTDTWCKIKGFEPRGAHDVWEKLQEPAGFLERRLPEEHRLQGGDGGGAGQGATDGPVRLQWRRMRSHLRAIRLLCEARGLFGANAQRTARAKLRPPPAPQPPPPFGVRARSSTGRPGAVEDSASEGDEVGGAIPPGAGIGDRPSGEQQRWAGWAVFSMVILTAASDDMSLLCRGIVQSVGEKGGLPRPQLLELLCSFYLSLQQPKPNTSTPPQFQAASSVSEEGGNSRGSTRLRTDLLACICALENHFLSLPLTVLRSARGCTQAINNGTPSHSDIHSGGAGTRLTPEQQAVVQTDVPAGDILKVVAFAGTGKTTCLREWARARPAVSIVYVAFNKAVCESAARSFGRNVQCRTMNSLAMAKVQGGRYQDPDCPSLTSSVPQLKKFIARTTEKPDKTDIRYSDAKLVMDTLKRYWGSKDDEIQLHHVPFNQLEKKPSDTWVVDTARSAWQRMQVPPADMHRDQRLRMSHSGILKLFQLNQKHEEPDLGTAFDVIMLDEAQDSNDCIADIVLRQTRSGCGLILVGDMHQVIYRFRGASDRMMRGTSNKTLRLTQVFRFGPMIASVANAVLASLKGERVPLLGNLALSSGNCGQVMFTQQRQEWLALNAEERGNYTFLARTNVALIQEALEAAARGERVIFQDGMGSIKLNDVDDLCKMMLGQPERSVKNPLLKDIGSIAALERQLVDTEDPDLSAIGQKLDMIHRLLRKGKTPQQIMDDMQTLWTVAASEPSAGPAITLSTVHKAKGLEFDTVMLADDFQSSHMSAGECQKAYARESVLRLSVRNTARMLHIQVNILYVAITRAERRLVLSDHLAEELTKLHMWDSLAVAGESTDPSVDPQGGCCLCGMAFKDESAPTAGEPRVTRIVLAGCASGKPFCKVCAVDAKGGGAFAYAAGFLSSGESHGCSLD